MKLRELTRAEYAAIVTVFRLYRYSNIWLTQLHNCIGEKMTTHLLRHRILQSKRVGGETMLSLSDQGLALASSLDPYVRPTQDNIRVGS
jgi:hypothetical protein